MSPTVVVESQTVHPPLLLQQQCSVAIYPGGAARAVEQDYSCCHMNTTSGASAPHLSTPSYATGAHNFRASPADHPTQSYPNYEADKVFFR